jgi:hypothetical protein
MDRRLVMNIVAASGLLAAIGCGRAPGIPPNMFPPPVTPPITGTIQQTIASGQARAALAGNYGGTVNKTNDYGAIQSQPYSFTITMSTASTPISAGQNAGKISFSSTGSIGPVNFSNIDLRYAYAYNLGVDTDGQPLIAYTFDTAMVEAIPFTGDGERPFQLMLRLVLKNNTVFVPTHSRIYFRDCVSALNPVCTDMLNVSSGGDLGRR